MAENFEPAQAFKVYTEDGEVYVGIGWYSATGTWGQPEPMIENPDGPGVAPWSFYHGADPFYIRSPETRGIHVP